MAQYFRDFNGSNLNSFVLQPETVEGLDGLVGVILVVVVDETVAEALTWKSGVQSWLSGG